MGGGEEMRGRRMESRTIEPISTASVLRFTRSRMPDDLELEGQISVKKWDESG